MIRLDEFRFNDCGIWFVRFAMDFSQKILGCGNKTGTMFLWNLESEHPNPARSVTRISCPLDSYLIQFGLGVLLTRVARLPSAKWHSVLMGALVLAFATTLLSGGGTQINRRT